MHACRAVSTKLLAGDTAFTSVEPCFPEVAQRLSGYQVGGTSAFGLRKPMPVYVEETVFTLPTIYINGGRRGYLVGIDPAVLPKVVSAKAVNCAIDEKAS